MGNMVRIKVKGFDKIKANAKKAIYAVLSDEQTLNDIGADMVRMQKQMIRKGIMPKTEEKFPPLSKKWIKYRTKLASKNKTAPSYGPRKSNITFTGQLVDAIGYKTNPAKREVTVELNDSTRKQYIGLRGKPIGDPNLTNQKLGEYMAEKGLTFIGLTDVMRERVIRVVERSLRRMLRTFR